MIKQCKNWKKHIFLFLHQFNIWSCHPPWQSPPASLSASPPPGSSGSPPPGSSGARPAIWPPSTAPCGAFLIFQRFFIQAYTAWIGLRWGESPGHLISWNWGRSAAELPNRVLCGTAQENDGDINLYRFASDREFSSHNGEISSSSSFMHTLLRKKIWGLYLKQEKSYQHIKTSQYFPRP